MFAMCVKQQKARNWKALNPAMFKEWKTKCSNCWVLGRIFRKREATHIWIRLSKSWIASWIASC